jgi:DMSO/TMAO reductase YedYZ molybdopterin-dependent catalytic subunit
MGTLRMSRRDVLLQGSMAVAGLALLRMPGLAEALSIQPGEEVLPWLDQPAPNPVPQVVGQQLHWEALDSWLTPNDQFFSVQHYDKPVLDAATWRLQIGGLVQQPLTLTLDDLKARPRQEIAFTLECSGNTGLPFLTGAVGNATWAGTPLAPVLHEAGVLDQGIEVVFFGSDMGVEDVRDIKMPQHFARSMSVADAMDPHNLLCYEMNGEPLPQLHGFPVRLIAPGWYGIANTKWLQRIEVLPTRYENRFMARDYVTIREQLIDGQSVWTEASVGRAMLKSAPARVSRAGGKYRIIGAAWGAPVARVEVQIDGGPWLPTTIDEGEDAEFAWKLWSLEWPSTGAGEHAITSRAIDSEGHIQPAQVDPWIAGKHTYWESNGQITRRVRVP